MNPFFNREENNKLSRPKLILWWFQTSEIIRKMDIASSWPFRQHECYTNQSATDESLLHIWNSSKMKSATIMTFVTIFSLLKYKIPFANSTSMFIFIVFLWLCELGKVTLKSTQRCSVVRSLSHVSNVYRLKFHLQSIPLRWYWMGK